MRQKKGKGRKQVLFQEAALYRVRPLGHLTQNCQLEWALALQAFGWEFLPLVPGDARDGTSAVPLFSLDPQMYQGHSAPAASPSQLSQKVRCKMAVNTFLEILLDSR